MDIYAYLLELEVPDDLDVSLRLLYLQPLGGVRASAVVAFATPACESLYITQGI